MTQRFGYTGPLATLQSHVDNHHDLTAYCNKGSHRSATLAPQEWAARFGVPLSAFVIEQQRRLVCTNCGARNGYFYIEIPGVRLPKS